MIVVPVNGTAQSQDIAVRMLPIIYTDKRMRFPAVSIRLKIQKRKIIEKLSFQVLQENACKFCSLNGEFIY